MSATFVDLVADYLALRRGLGCPLAGQGKLLLDFGRFLDRIDHRGPITTEVALRWARAPRSKDQAQTARRLGTIRGFLRHRAAFDPGNEVPAPQLLGSGIRRKPPHIFTPAEVDALLAAGARLRPRGGLRPHTYVTLFSLLFSTGLRISEALALKDSDVDLGAGVLNIRHGKFDKARLVPLHATALRPLHEYRVHRDRVAPVPASFFRTQRGESLSYVAVRMTFVALRTRLGWTSVGRARRPRLHDIRHTFAVRCLTRWYREGVAVDGRIAHLATYLGHVEVRDTYWYLSAVPELLSLAADRFDCFVRGVQEVSS